MYTISDIVTDINRGCARNNMLEDKFSYRIIFYINEDGKGIKHYIDTRYSDLRRILESVIRKYLTLTNRVVISEIKVWKDGKCICLQSRPYSFSLDEYFNRLTGKSKTGNKKRSNVYGRYAISEN